MTWQDAVPVGSHPSDEQLAEYQDEGLQSAAERQRIEAHLESCAECRAIVEQFGSMATMLRALPSYPAPRPFTIDELSVRRTRRPIWQAYASLAASLVLMLATVASLLSTSGPSEFSPYASSPASQAGGGAAQPGTAPNADDSLQGRAAPQSEAAPKVASDAGIATASAGSVGSGEAPSVVAPSGPTTPSEGPPASVAAVATTASTDAADARRATSAGDKAAPDTGAPEGQEGSITSMSPEVRATAKVGDAVGPDEVVTVTAVEPAVTPEPDRETTEATPVEAPAPGETDVGPIATTSAAPVLLTAVPAVSQAAAAPTAGQAGPQVAATNTDAQARVDAPPAGAPSGDNAAAARAGEPTGPGLLTYALAVLALSAFGLAVYLFVRRAGYS
ncbi:MAG: zf-HC2 domain-containing protein [Chloroflexia bacterium]